MTTSSGLHHITAVAGDPKRNVAFYTRTLGLHMVKRTVNFDDPGTWHLYYGDETGSPGSILTFFPWAGIGPGRPGRGDAVEIGFAIPPAAVSFWLDRLATLGVPHDPPVKRFGETVIGFKDPDGLFLELVAHPAAARLPGYATEGVPAEMAIRGFSGVTLWVDAPEATAEALAAGFGYREVGREGALHRFEAAGAAIGRRIDLRVVGGFPRGQMGAGSIHHIAFRAADDAAQGEMVAALRGLGVSATEQKDRQYFRSVYFRAPSSTIFEIATDDPGFAIDEDAARLGEALRLPPWLEPHRPQIEAALPELA
jgi:glyoxalase family protein